MSTIIRRTLRRTSMTRLVVAALLTATAPVSLAAQGEASGRPMESLSINFMVGNRTAHPATITRVESVDASGRTTNWSFGNPNQGGVDPGASVRVSITTPYRGASVEAQEEVLKPIKESKFRITVRSNGVTRVITHSGRGATKTANGIKLEDIWISGY